MWDVKDFIREFGEQAYHKAVQSTVTAVQLGDQEGAAHFAAVANELMRRRYHKFPKKEEEDD